MNLSEGTPPKRTAKVLDLSQVHMYDHCPVTAVRRGIEEPCGKPPVALRWLYDEWDDREHATPVCVAHSRKDEMISLAEVVGINADYVRYLRDENADLKAKLDRRIEDVIDEGMGLESHTSNVDHVAGTSFSDLSLKTSGAADHVMLAMFDAMGDMLGDATNYVETEIRRRGKFPLTVTVRRHHRPTPHELRERAERRVVELEQEVVALRSTGGAK